MKPWEETWGLEAEDYPRIQTPEEDIMFCGQDYDGCWDHGAEVVARARLAAAAPEMARLLLSLEQSGYSFSLEPGEGGEYACPCCEANRTYEDHADDCAWVAVLKKAGVLT